MIGTRAPIPKRSMSYPVLYVIERIVAPLGLRVDESSPWVDARLSDGSRVQEVVPGSVEVRRWSPT